MSGPDLALMVVVGPHEQPVGEAVLEWPSPSSV
jgi:hypothetical protein